MPGPEFERDAQPETIVEGLEEHGYAIVHELADPETLARMNADFDPYLDAVKLGETDFAGRKTKRINNLIAKSEACQDLAMNPTVMAVCDAMLLPHCARYHLHVGTLIELQPGEAKQVMHRDGQIYPVRFPAIVTTIGTIWACEDFTEENGGTRIVPGSHRWGHSREPRDDEIINAVMPAGSVLIYTSNFLHGGGGNHSNGARRGMALHYNLGWLRQEENQYLSIPPEKARGIRPEVLQLIGYDFAAPYLGFVEEGHPLTLADSARERDMDRTGGEALMARHDAIRPIILQDAPEGASD